MKELKVNFQQGDGGVGGGGLGGLTGASICNHATFKMFVSTAAHSGGLSQLWNGGTFPTAGNLLHRSAGFTAPSGR